MNGRPSPSAPAVTDSETRTAHPTGDSQVAGPGRTTTAFADAGDGQRPRPFGASAAFAAPLDRARTAAGLPFTADGAAPTENAAVTAPTTSSSSRDDSEQIALDALAAVRSAAANWLTGVTTLLGLFSISGIVFAGNNLTGLGGGKLIGVGITLGAALVLAAAAIFTGYNAAYGWPSTKNLTTPQHRSGKDGATGVGLPRVFLFNSRAVSDEDIRTNIEKFHRDTSRRTLQAVIALRVSVTCAMTALTALAITFYAIYIFK